MGCLRRLIFRFYVLVLLCLLPNVSCARHVAINIQGKQVLVIMEAIDLLHALHQISNLKREGVYYIINEAFIVSLENSLSLLSHYLDHLAQVFHLLKAYLDPHRTVHRHIA